MPATRNDDFVLPVVLSLAGFVAALIGVVVVVGLIEHKLDFTGVLSMLGGLLASIMGGFFLRWRAGTDDD